MEWISVKDRLPLDNEKVLCYWETYVYGGIEKRYHVLTYNQSYNLTLFKKATHWSYLPEPPNTKERANSEA